jgi:hypothetical protein
LSVGRGTAHDIKILNKALRLGCESHCTHRENRSSSNESSHDVHLTQLIPLQRTRNSTSLTRFG